MAEVVIAHLGAKGDGVAMRDGEAVYVPFALPGERWRLAPQEAVRLTDSEERAAPACRHFMQCGGCVAQHMAPALYREWKRDLVVEAFRHRGIAAEVAPLVVVDAASRRRAFLGMERRGGEVIIGFREEGQHTLVDLAECPVLDPLIVGALPGLRALAQRVMADRAGGRLVVTRLDHGLDVSFDNGRRDLSPHERSEIGALAQRMGLLRLVVGGELIVAAGRPVVTIGGVAVEIEPGLFLQAVPEAERMLAAHCLAALPKSVKRVADLFSGAGTLTLPVARRASVTAYDSDKRAIGALSAAVRHAQGLKPVTALVRDLFRDPLSVRELAQFDAVVLDPPRAGAAAQAERLAKSTVPVVIAVSCSPATLARDARVLIDGGYRMGPVMPIDQFLYSPHVEAVVVFRR
ncbi:RsmD family RNA methyltransferase [Hyphomicrobium sp.]|uniref:class I SAM-dependent RNA methyltransferase n=1 Tax=Hyphomicrobium sp. TaxID=82 RepID=UPI0025B86FDC|nr:RsmD family RNA methyltransferase [Hyphomicrobium sp.]MCC7252266.1 class I SAM-dependent RNA methyltransferase [Hyphomicrobium sp.]